MLLTVGTPYACTRILLNTATVFLGFTYVYIRHVTLHLLHNTSISTHVHISWAPKKRKGKKETKEGGKKTPKNFAHPSPRRDNPPGTPLLRHNKSQSSQATHPCPYPPNFTKPGPRPHFIKLYPTFLPSKRSCTHDHSQRNQSTPGKKRKQTKCLLLTFIQYVFLLLWLFV